MNQPVYTAIYFHPEYGPSYNSLHTEEEFLAVSRFKNSAWSKLIENSTGKIVGYTENLSLPPAPIPSRSPE